MRARYWIAFFGSAGTLNIKSFLPKLQTPSEIQIWEKSVASVTAHLDKAKSSIIERRMTEAVATVFSDVKDDVACLACQAGIRVLRSLAKSELTRKHFINSIKILCSTVAHQPRSVCKGVAESTGSSIFDILKRLPLLQGTIPQMACYALGNVCPMPEIQLEPLTLPKPAPEQSRLPNYNPLNVSCI